jgi:hypothetical protein
MANICSSSLSVTSLAHRTSWLPLRAAERPTAARIRDPCNLTMSTSIPTPPRLCPTARHLRPPHQRAQTSMAHTQVSWVHQIRVGKSRSPSVRGTPCIKSPGDPRVVERDRNRPPIESTVSATAAGGPSRGMHLSAALFPDRGRVAPLCRRIGPTVQRKATLYQVEFKSPPSTSAVASTDRVRSTYVRRNATMTTSLSPTTSAALLSAQTPVTSTLRASTCEQSKVPTAAKKGGGKWIKNRSFPDTFYPPRGIQFRSGFSSQPWQPFSPASAGTSATS